MRRRDEDHLQREVVLVDFVEDKLIDLGIVMGSQRRSEDSQVRSVRLDEVEIEPVFK